MVDFASRRTDLVFLTAPLRLYRIEARWTTYHSPRHEIIDAIVNVPVRIGNAIVDAGDVVIGDDDGVMIVPRADVATAIAASAAREKKEESTRAAFRRGESGLDLYGLRSVLAEQGVEYVSADTSA